MADGIYIGMAGAVARAQQLDAVADNLANAQTPGYKAERAAFEAFLPPSGAPDKTYAAAVAPGLDLRPGPSKQTGNKLDVAIEGDAFLAVRLPDGQTQYTRNGRISLDENGRLIAAGQPLLSRSGLPILVPPGAVPEIREDGRVMVEGVEHDQLALFRVDGPISRAGPLLLAAGPGATVQPAFARVRVGELEMANYSALDATVELVSAQRHYETSMQALQTYRRLDERATELGRVR